MLNLHPQVYHSWKQVVIRFHGLFLLFQFLPQNCDPWVELKALSEYLPLGMREQHIEDLNSQQQIIIINFHYSVQLLTLKRIQKVEKARRKGSQATKTVDPGLNFLSNSSLHDLFHIYLFHIVPASISNPFYSFPLEMGFFGQWKSAWRDSFTGRKQSQEGLPNAKEKSGNLETQQYCPFYPHSECASSKESN